MSALSIQNRLNHLERTLYSHCRGVRRLPLLGRTKERHCSAVLFTMYLAPIITDNISSLDRSWSLQVRKKLRARS